MSELDLQNLGRIANEVLMHDGYVVPLRAESLLRLIAAVRAARWVRKAYELDEDDNCCAESLCESLDGITDGELKP